MNQIIYSIEISNSLIDIDKMLILNLKIIVDLQYKKDLSLNLNPFFLSREN